MLTGKNIEKLIKKMNMNIVEIDAEEVIIKTKEKGIIISKPEVMLVDMMGKDVYQITGEVSESPIIKEEDIKLVMEKTGKDRNVVIRKLEELNNDLAKAILELKDIEDDTK